MGAPANIPPEYFVVMIDYGRPGREAVVDMNFDWNDAIDRVHEAAGDGHKVLFVHHIHDGTVEDRSEEAFQRVMADLADNIDPLSANQRGFIEEHISIWSAASFPSSDADRQSARFDHARDLRKVEAA